MYAIRSYYGAVELPRVPLLEVGAAAATDQQCVAGEGHALLGARAFDSADVQWLMISDRGQAFLGWHLSRNEPPSLPLRNNFV